MTIKRILVVDDSPTERHVMKTLLSSNGYEVITAESGEEGIAKAKSELPDLILMDVVMPGLNGYQATRTLTRDEATRNKVKQLNEELVKIGQSFGGRDHTTVMHANKKIRHLMGEDRKVFNQVAELTNRIKQRAVQR